MSGWPPGLDLPEPHVAGALLAILGILFLARVMGQLIVAVRAPAWLPPMQEWYSGVLPYRPLLASQAVILTIIGTLSLGLLLDIPVFAARRPEVGGLLLWLGWIYLLSMVVRYVLHMARHPEARWLGRVIPIVFHIVLAMCVLVVGSYLRG